MCGSPKKGKAIHRLFACLAGFRWLWTLFLVTRATGSPVLGVVAGLLLDTLCFSIIALRPTGALTRFAVGAVQAAWPVVWVLIVPGFEGASLYAFAVLTVLAFYRDWRVLVLAVLLLVPQELLLRSHVSEVVISWIGVQAIVLALACFRMMREMDDAAGREAMLQHTALVVQQKVETRTRALQAKSERYRALVENTEALPFEYDIVEKRPIYIAPKTAKLYGVSMEQLREPGFMVQMIHPDDRAAVREALDAFVRGERASTQVLDYRVCVPAGVFNVRTFFSNLEGSCLRGLSIDVTRHARLEQDLRRAQRLESVGRLAAGVAHEINTPVQFIGDSLEFAQSAVTDLVGLVTAQQAALAYSETDLAMHARAAFESADVDFVRAQLPKSLERARDGVERISKIVKSMRAFTRHDNETMTSCNLRQAIESTLVVARSAYVDVADVELECDDLPRVLCYASEINQVLLNLIVNASQAIAAAARDRRGLITVSLRQANGDAIISIRDTGAGIPDDVQERVFEQFFTTKPVGEGTGLGLSLSRSIIVDKHDGALTFETSPAGTTFHVRIPMRRPATAPEVAVTEQLARAS